MSGCRPKVGETADCRSGLQSGGAMSCSNKDRLYNLAMHVGEAVMAALKTVRQPFVIYPETIENGCLQVVNVNRVFRDIE